MYICIHAQYYKKFYSSLKTSFDIELVFVLNYRVYLYGCIHLFLQYNHDTTEYISLLLGRTYFSQPLQITNIFKHINLTLINLFLPFLYLD